MNLATLSSFPVTLLWCHRCTDLHDWSRIWRGAIWITHLLVYVIVLGESPAQGDTRLIPSVGVSERYDSNVFISPSGLTPPGRKPWDMATSIIPGLEIVDKERAIETDLKANVNGTVFVNNPELNFVSSQVSAVMRFDGLVRHWIPGLKLQVADSFLYSPESPSFVTAGSPVVNENPFARGIQPVRADTYNNTASVAASYPLSRSLAVQGTYAYSLFRVGKILVEPSADAPVVFFNTDFHRMSFGPTYDLARGDRVGVDYKRVTATFSDKSANVGSLNVDETITAQGAEAHYATGGVHWGAYVSGGATIVEQDGTAFFSGRATLSGSHDPSTRFSIDISRQLAPAFFGTPGVVVSTATGLTVERRLAESFTVVGSGNYALNQGTGTTVLRFESYSAKMLFNYHFSRTTTASISYQYTHFEAHSTNFDTLVNRSLAMLSVTAKWK